MKAIFHKLKGKAGESLVESLAAILIFTMASIIMYSMVSSAGNINMTAKEMDTKNQIELVAVEKGDPSAKNGSAVITFTMNGSNIAQSTVDIYGGEDGSLYTYFLRPSAGGTP